MHELSKFKWSCFKFHAIVFKQKLHFTCIPTKVSKFIKLIWFVNIPNCHNFIANFWEFLESFFFDNSYWHFTLSEFMRKISHNVQVKIADLEYPFVNSFKPSKRVISHFWLCYQIMFRRVWIVKNINVFFIICRIKWCISNWRILCKFLNWPRFISGHHNRVYMHTKIRRQVENLLLYRKRPT